MELTDKILQRRKLWKTNGRMRTQRLNSNWESVYESLQNAYMEYDKSGPPESTESTATHDDIHCVDVFGKCRIFKLS